MRFIKLPTCIKYISTVGNCRVKVDRFTKQQENHIKNNNVCTSVSFLKFLLVQTQISMLPFLNVVINKDYRHFLPIVFLICDCIGSDNVVFVSCIYNNVILRIVQTMIIAFLLKYYMNMIQNC